MAKETIFAEQELEFTKVDGEVIYATVWAPAPNIAADDTVTISWDGVEYTCIYKVLPDDEDIYYAGNEALIGVGDDTGEPFCLVSIIVGDDSAAQIGTFSTDPTHTVAIYKEATSAPQIVLLDKGKNEHKFPLDLPLLIPDTEGGLREYSYGAALTDMEIPLDLASGNQPLAAPDGYLVKTATILKPATLLPENIKSGVKIAGVTGDYVPDTEEATVELDMAEGNQTVTPSGEKLLAKVTVKKPKTLVPENILLGVEIGGVVGSAVTKVDTEETTVELDFSGGDMTVKPTEGKFLSRVDIPKPETLVPENIAKDVNIAGVVGTHEGSGGGSTDPYIVYSDIDYTSETSFQYRGGVAKFFGFNRMPTGVLAYTGVKSVDFSGSPHLENIAMRFCYNGLELESIQIPESVVYICDDAFSNCSTLAKVEIPDSIRYIGSYVFNGTALYKDTSNFRNNALIVGKHLCAVQTSVKGTYTIEDGVLSLAASAFGWNSGLTGIVIPSSMRSICAGALTGCYKATSVVFTDPNNWYISLSPYDPVGTAIPSEDLADPSIAYKYLYTTYKNYFWFKKT